MQPELVLGFGLMLVGAICGGSFGLPSKYVKKDTPWEVLWGPFFFFVTILIPVIVAPLVVNDLCGVYEQAGGVLRCRFAQLWLHGARGFRASSRPPAAAALGPVGAGGLVAADG